MRSDRARAALALPLALGLAGCISFCECDKDLRAASRGDPAAINEMGELGRPRIPSSGRRLARIEDAIEAIRPNLEAPDAYLRTLTVDSLRHLTERAPDIYRNRFQTLFDPALADPAPDVRWRAAWALGRISETRPALRKLAADKDETVAATACWAIGRARDEGAYLELAAALDRPGEVRKAALAALSRMTNQTFGDDVARWKRFCADEARRQEQLAKDRAASEAAAVASPTSAPVASPTTAPVGSPAR